MTVIKKMSWRNFTWKRFFVFSLFLFLSTLLVSMTWNYFDPEEKVTNAFFTIELVKRAIMALIVGLLLAFTLEPGSEKKDT